MTLKVFKVDISAPSVTTEQGLNLLEQGSSPATPPSGVIALYSQPDHNLYYKNDTGLEKQLLSSDSIHLPYVQNFNNTTDWGSASGGLYTITVPGTSHGFGINVNNVVLYETVGGESVLVNANGLSIDNATGDVSFTVSETPDGRFTGKVIIIEGQAIAGGSGGVTTIGNINSTTKSANGANIVSSSLILQDADDANGGLINIGYQTLPGAKTCRNDDAGGVKGLGMYNANITNNNNITLNAETDTTGAGAQTEFATTFYSVNFKDHNHATVTAEVGISTYINGVQKTMWYFDQNLNLSTDGKLNLNGDFNVNNGFIRGGNQLDVLTGQGFNQGGNSLGGQIVIPATGPITGTNIFGTNLSQLVEWSEDMDGGIIPFLGVSIVGYVGQVAGLVSGKTMEVINMAVAGASDGGSVAGAILNNYNMYTAAGLVGGTPMTINNMRMFYTPASAGGIATNEFGVAIDSPTMDNYFDKSLTIGGGAGSKTTNPDTALEIKSLKTVKLSNFTTTQKNAIAAPEAGMILFDATLGKMCVYSGTSWETITSI